MAAGDGFGVADGVGCGVAFGVSFGVGLGVAFGFTVSAGVAVGWALGGLCGLAMDAVGAALGLGDASDFTGTRCFRTAGLAAGAALGPGVACTFAWLLVKGRCHHGAFFGDGEAVDGAGIGLGVATTSICLGLRGVAVGTALGDAVGLGAGSTFFTRRFSGVADGDAAATGLALGAASCTWRLRFSGVAAADAPGSALAATVGLAAGAVSSSCRSFRGLADGEALGLGVTTTFTTAGLTGLRCHHLRFTGVAVGAGLGDAAT